LEHFPALPRPLADVLGWRGRVFDAIAKSEAEARGRMFRIEPDGPLGLEMFAEDGFHPSETLHAAFADAVMAQLEAGAATYWSAGSVGSVGSVTSE
jgi:lysophospholipase L1-like esterase